MFLNELNTNQLTEKHQAGHIQNISSHIKNVVCCTFVKNLWFHCVNTDMGVLLPC